MSMFTLHCGTLTLADIQTIFDDQQQLTLSDTDLKKVQQSANTITQLVQQHKRYYGINTGFGQLANVAIDASQLQQLQKNIVLSHATGVGTPLAPALVKLILLLKINSLGLGFSGIQPSTLARLVLFFNENIIPCVPSQGSVGASGDLAPLAHLACPLIGEGYLISHDQIIHSKHYFKKLKLPPLILAAKEGLALLNGTQVSTAIALDALIQAEKLLRHAIIVSSLTVDAVRGSDAPFDERIHLARGHQTQQVIAFGMRTLLAGSQIRDSHSNCSKVQDPYSIRCHPQVLGACLGQLQTAANTLITEANGCTDNPLIFEKDDDIAVLSGGNFHAEPVAMAADNMALAIAEMGAISERRIAMLMDANFTNLPYFLVEKNGLNSGFMMAHVTSSALASENKQLATPCSIDSLPTSANQEDHVSMATNAANRLHKMLMNTRHILAIEFLAALQAIDMLKPLTTSKPLAEVQTYVRNFIKPYDSDRFFADDIHTMTNIIDNGKLLALMPTQLQQVSLLDP